MPYTSILAQNGALVQALLAAAVAADTARRMRALSPSGALAATAVGGAIVAGAGLRGGAALMTFFVSSTLLGRLPARSGRRQHRGNERDAVQVLANGGAAAALALAAGNHRAQRFVCPGFAGALATATADTWATEIGSRSSPRPRSIVTGRPVAAGTSGGVSWAGLVASAAGAAAIGAVMAAGAPQGQGHGRALMRAVVLGGSCGALIDSMLGATVQEVRFCDVCGEETEQRRHQCGKPTTTVRGISWFGNDVVNFVATLAGAAITMALAEFSDPLCIATTAELPERSMMPPLPARMWPAFDNARSIGGRVPFPHNDAVRRAVRQTLGSPTAVPEPIQRQPKRPLGGIQ